MKSVYVFPGQGSQFRGMGESLFDQLPVLVEQAYCGPYCGGHL